MDCVTKRALGEWYNDNIQELQWYVDEAVTRKAVGASSSSYPYKAPQEGPVQDGTLLSDSSHKKIKWANNVYETWIKARNGLQKETLDTTALLDLFLLEKTDTICENLCKFFTEITKATGDPYPPKTLYELAASFQMDLNDRAVDANIFTDKKYRQILQAIDKTMKTSTKQGLQPVKKKADFITLDMEQTLWEKNILSTDSPHELVRTVYYILGVQCGLRSREEHRYLRAPGPTCQLQDLGDHFEYTEMSSKNNQGGIKERNLKRKIVKIFPTKTKSCPVAIIKRYVSLLPPTAQAWYCHPLKVRKLDCWYSKQPIGVNTLSDFMKSIQAEAGWEDGFFSGHSLRATCATRMAQAAFEVPLIKERTGHRSDKSVAEYAQTSTKKLVEISKTLSGNAEPSVELPSEEAPREPASDAMKSVVINISF